MMQRFQEDTVRYLYLMQILERPPDSPPPSRTPIGGAISQGNTNALPAAGGNGGSRPPRGVTTSVDDLEEAFQRKKRRELEQARMAGGGSAAEQTVQQIVRGSEKVGRNDPCPCGSGKKYKKCHGA
jgi:preprotein translocase subunit SecA